LLERKKDHLVRSIILELHLSIEDMIDDAIIAKLSSSGRGKRRGAAPELRDALQGRQAIRFPAKLAFARTLRLVTRTEAKHLEKLNSLRNQCSHNWLLNVVVRRRTKPSRPKRPLLEYEGKKLHSAETFERFMNDYARLYLRLFMRFVVP